METKWIDFSKKKPSKGEEFLVVWNLNDGEYPVVTSMDWEPFKKQFTDPRGTGKNMNGEILLWARLPKPPTGIKKSIWSPTANQMPINLDEVERKLYGQCKHGNNMAQCDECTGILRKTQYY